MNIQIGFQVNKNNSNPDKIHNSKERVIFRNATRFTVFVRVYENVPPKYKELTADDTNNQGLTGWLYNNIIAGVYSIQNAAISAMNSVNYTYEARSEIVRILPEESIEFNMESARNNRWVYYTTATEHTKIEEGLSSNNPSLQVRVNRQCTEQLSPNKINGVVRVVLEPSMLEKQYAFLGTRDARIDDIHKTKAAQLRKENYEKQLELDARLGVPFAVLSTDRDIPLSDEENEFWKKRCLINNHAIHNLWTSLGFEPLTLDPTDHIFPRIGLCSSGGGMRAQLALSGFLGGLTDEGLTDMIGCISATSGSTWTLADWLALGGNPESHRTLYSRTEKAFQRGVWTKENLEKVNFLMPQLLAERESDEEHPGSLLHEWAIRLHETVLAGLDPNNSEHPDNRMKSLYELENDPLKTPLLIFNTIATTQLLIYDTENAKKLKAEQPHKSAEEDLFKIQYLREQQEKTVFDVTFIPDHNDRPTNHNRSELGRPIPFCRIPTRALGRKFDKNGKAEISEKSAVPLSLISEVAICGSALTVDSHRLSTEHQHLSIGLDVLSKISGMNLSPYWVKHKAPHKYSKDPKNPSEVPYSGFFDDSQLVKEGYSLFKGFPVNRPIRGRGGEKAILCDAGIGHNLPMEAIVRPNRGCDLAFVLDVSGDLNVRPGDELFKAMQNVTTFGRKLPSEFSDRKKFDEKVKKAIEENNLPIIFGDPSKADEYCVVYIPTVQIKTSDHFLGTWSQYDPMKNETLKLRWDPSEMLKLQTFGRKLAKHIAPKLREVILQRTQAKMKLKSQESE